MKYFLYGGCSLEAGGKNYMVSQEFVIGGHTQTAAFLSDFFNTASDKDRSVFLGLSVKVLGLAYSPHVFIHDVTDRFRILFF